MTHRRIRTGLLMILKMLIRRRIVLILLVIIPFVFLSIVELTTSERILPFKLASIDTDTFVEVSEKGISFVFFAVASAGFLVAFLALNLIQKNWKANRRLVLSGYRPSELLSSILLSLFLVIILISVFIGIITNVYFTIDHLGIFIFGLASIGFVYGSYGLMIGSLIKGELEGILMIVLLVNIDVGWLQNPLFYAEAENQLIIRFLPAYFPSQTAIISAFTDHSILSSSAKAMVYGLGFLLISMLIFSNKMRIRK